MKVLVLLLLLLVVGQADQTVLVTSPKGAVQINIGVVSGEIQYQVIFEDELIVPYSALRIMSSSGARLSPDSVGAVVGITGPVPRDDDWTRVWGKSAVVRNRFTELLLEVRFTRVGRVTIATRVYDDGVGFRYTYWDPQASSFYELTRFNLENLGNPTIWAAKGWKHFVGPVDLQTIPSHIMVNNKKGKDANTPITVRRSDKRLHLSFHEAGLTGDAGVSPTVENKKEVVFLVKRSMNTRRRAKRAAEMIAPLPIESAWRTIQIARKAGDLVQSDLIPNLNAPMANIVSIKGRRFPEWVKPGISVWEFRVRGFVAPDSFKYSMNDATMHRLADFASSQGFPYLLVDAGWANRGAQADLLNPGSHRIDVKGLIKYAASIGVGIILYVDHVELEGIKGRKEIVLRTFHEWGIKGIKEGFVTNVNSNIAASHQEVLATLKLCAYYELLYIVHEPPKPTGWERTFPNYMSTEYTDSSLDDPTKKGKSAVELVTLPFVHHLAGPVDMSAGMFALDTYITRERCYRQLYSTVMSQIAQGFCFPTGVWTLPDGGESYNAKPELLRLLREMNDFLLADETTVDGEIGEYVFVTKRRGNRYMTCGLTSARGIVTIPYPSGQAFDVTVYSDGPEADGAYSNRGPEIPRNRKDAFAIASDHTKREFYVVQALGKTRQTKASSSFRTIDHVQVANAGGFCVTFY